MWPLFIGPLGVPIIQAYPINCGQESRMLDSESASRVQVPEDTVQMEGTIGLIMLKSIGFCDKNTQLVVLYLQCSADQFRTSYIINHLNVITVET